MSALAAAGVVAAALAASAAILLGPSRARSAAMLIALALFPLLIAGDQWHSAAISDLRHSPARLAAFAVLAGAIALALALLFRRRPVLLPLAIIAALPFRVPLSSGGDQANLLIPLYLVIAAGVLAVTLRDWSANPRTRLLEHGAAGQPAMNSAVWLSRILASVVVLYALQSLYSDDFSQGLQNACFFIVPFSIAFVLMRDTEWDRRLLLAALAVVVTEALLFVAVGFVEYGVRDLIWNGGVIRSNEFHVYFRVNSLFWDPNVYGRYLALVIVALLAALLWTRNRRACLLLAAAAALIWLGLVTTFSQSSFAALVAGLVVLAALRWSLRWTAIACGFAALAGIAFLLAAGGSLKIDLSTGNTVNKDTGGRANLISGGADLFANRPLLGYGSGSFSVAFRDNAGGKAPVTESHTEPITVAAEQGIVGLTLYLALLITALWTMTAGLRASMPGLGRAPPAGGAGGGDHPLAGQGGGGPTPVTGPAGRAHDAARAATLAMFAALVVHTFAYAGFYEDPITWILLAMACSLTIRPSA